MAQIGTWCDMYKSPQAPQIAELRYSGTPTGATFTYSITVLQQTESFLSVSSGTDIDLPAGHYYAVSYPDFTRTIASRNNKVFWFVDGVQVGKEGGSPSSVVCRGYAHGPSPVGSGPHGDRAAP